MMRSLRIWAALALLLLGTLSLPAQDTASQESRRAAIAALTAKDWALCAERCANCRASGGCLAEIAVPPDHRLNARPCSPEECPRFAAKEGISPERSELRKQPLGGCAA